MAARGPIRPNELRAPGEREAIARIEAVFAAVDRLSPDDLNAAAVPSLDPGQRAAGHAAVDRLADSSGRGDLLDEARDQLRNAVLARFGAGLNYAYALRPGATARPEDIVVITSALLDLVGVAVVEDLLDPDEAAALARPGRALLGLGDEDDPRGPGDEATGAVDLYAIGAPTDADWAAAEHGDTAINLDDGGRRPIR